MRPYDGGTIDPRRKSEPGSGGHKGRPYERTEGGSVGAALMAARAACTLAERTRPNGPAVSGAANSLFHPAVIPLPLGGGIFLPGCKLDAFPCHHRASKKILPKGNETPIYSVYYSRRTH